MSIEEIKEQSGLGQNVSESIYWHSIWIRKASPNIKVNWMRLLNEKDYREGRVK